MSRIRLVGIALALCAFAACNVPNAEASKVSMEAPAVSPTAQPELNKAEDVTAVKPSSPGTEPSARPAGRQPVQYDALPEHERKLRTLDEILGQIAEA